ncbi:MAG: SRPBCC family protein, partial [Pseudomonadota bacterium]
SVKRDDGYIFVTSETFMAAPIEDVFDILSDYDSFERVSSTFVESHFVEREPDGSGVVYTKAKGCVAFFCSTIERTETLEVEAPTFIQTSVVPGTSDVDEGVARWRLESEGDGTRVLYEMEMKPNFWVPPLLGTFLMKRALGKAGKEAAQRIEDIALGLYPPPAEADAADAAQ